MKPRILIFLMLAFSLCVVKAQPSDAYIQNIMANGNIPGVGAVIIKDGKWKWENQWGQADIPNNVPVQRDNIFFLGSISKTMIATSLMQLWEQGAFELDDDINLYLPFQVHHPAYPNDTITIRMLAAHTSSLCDDWGSIDVVYGDSPVSLGNFLFDYFDPSGAYYSATNNFCSFQPGTDWSYSNTGTALAAYIVEQISGIPFDQYCDQHIFQPLCMDNTSFTLAGLADTTQVARPYSWDSVSAGYYDVGLLGFPIYPAGQLRSTYPSLARFMNMYMHYGTFEGTQILDSSTVALIMSEQFPSVPNAAGQGFFFYQYGPAWGHAGGFAGASTNMFFDYGTNTGVIVLGNGDANNGSAIDAVFDTLYLYGTTLTTLSTDTFPSCGLTTGVFDGNQDNLQINLFPNPFEDLLYLEIENAPGNVAEILIVNLLGEIIMEEKREISKAAHFNVKHLPSGVYTVHIKVDSKRQTFKIVKC